MDLSDVGAPWLATMRELAGVKEYAGGEDNPTVLGWAGFIGGAYPEMAAYAALYKSDDIAWCGLAMAYALAKHGIRPPFGATDVERFLWANSYAPWGLRLEAPRQGCIVVFKWASGGGHVGIIDRVEGRTLYVAGGNQSDAVNVTPFAWDSSVVGFFWPPQVAAQPSLLRTPAAVKMRMGKAITLAEARRVNGHLAVYKLPANDGGGTYEVAGINDRYHPVEAARLKAMIESGRYLEAEDFVGEFTAAYTDVADVWTSSWGIEFYLRDCVFNRGPTGAARILQRALLIRGDTIGPDGVDGEVGPNTMAAIGRQETSVDAMLIALRQAREDYERENVGYRANLWNGLINRFNSALTVARQFQTEQQKGTTTMPDPAATGQTKPSDTVTPYNASIEDCIIELAKAQRPILERFLKAPSAMTDEEKRRLVIMALGGTPPAASPVVLLPGTTAPAAGGTATPAAAAASPTTVNISGAIAGVLASLGLSATGVIGAPVGPDATMTGMLLPLLSMGAGALGIPAPIVNIISGLVGKLFAPTPPKA